MTRQEFFGRSRKPVMEYGLNQAVELLCEIDKRIPGYRPANLSIVEDKLIVTIWKGNRFYTYTIDDSDFFRKAADIAEDLVKLQRAAEVSQ